MSERKIAVGVLAYNVQDYINKVIHELLTLNTFIIIVNDCSTDKTSELLNQFKENENIKIVENKKNYGAGYSSKLLFQEAEKQGYDFLIKIDGDGQFKNEDVKKIVNLAKYENYDFIKSNRFWSGGIEGSIPKQRYFGNLLATFFMQLVSGTNNIFDPLNGLFGCSVKILDFLDSAKYPKRYGYPYFITITAIINRFKTYQINNVVKYEDQESSLKALKMLFLILRLNFYFYSKKNKLKKQNGPYQKSAFFDSMFKLFLFISSGLFLSLIFDIYFNKLNFVSASTLLFLVLTTFVVSIFFFSSSYKEEIKLRRLYISNEIEK